MKLKKRTNPIARSLRSAHLRPQRVPSKKAYTRKGRSQRAAPSELQGLLP